MKNSKKNETIIQKVTNNSNRIFYTVLSFTICMIAPTVCFASGDGTTFFDNFVDLFFGWVQKAGMLVAAFGGIKLALGIHSQTEEEKIQGLKTLIAGAIVFAIGTAPGMFGL